MGRSNHRKLKFLCSECGACCKIAGKLGLMPSSDDGSCVYLNAENRCDIYDKRPEHCDVNRMYYVNRKKDIIPQTMKKIDYFKLSTRICHKMIDEEGIDERYKVDIGDYDI